MNSVNVLSLILSCGKRWKFSHDLILNLMLKFLRSYFSFLSLPGTLCRGISTHVTKIEVIKHLI